MDLTPQEQTNQAVFQAFLDSLQTGTTNQWFRDFFRSDTVLSVGKDTPRRLFDQEGISTLPDELIFIGPDEAIQFFALLDTERDVIAFDFHEFFPNDDSLAAFGSFQFRSPITDPVTGQPQGGPGDLGQNDFAVEVTFEDGKVTEFFFIQDGYLNGALYRREDEITTWRTGDGDQVRDVFIGTNREDDTLTPISPTSSNWMFGYGGNDQLFGGDLGDRLDGGIGQNTLTGGAGADLFVIGQGAEGTPVNRHDGVSDFTLDTITDFVLGEDQFVLTWGLTFDQLTFAANGADLEIRVGVTDELLAIVQGASGITLSPEDAISLPPEVDVVAEIIPPGNVVPGFPDGLVVRADYFGDRPANTSQDQDANITLISEFLNFFQQENGAPDSFIDDNFDPGIEFTIATSETGFFQAERVGVLPYTGLYEGIEEVKDFFDILSVQRDVENFIVESVFAGENGSVAAFGTYEYLSPLEDGGSGDVLGSGWGVRAWITEEAGQPQIYRFHFFEDTAAVANGYRHKFEGTPPVEWTITYAGRDQLFLTGTDAPETIIGRDVISVVDPPASDPVPLINRIFGYDGDDRILGQTGDDFLFGGEDQDTLEGAVGNDDLYGQPGDDTLLGQEGDDNLYGNEGDDTLTGGPGADIFVLSQGEGSDTITDYVDGEDRIGLLGEETFADLIIAQVGNDTTLRLQTTELLATLLDVDATTLTEEDFTKRSDSGAIINPQRDLLGYPDLGFGPDFPVFDHPLVDLTPETVGGAPELVFGTNGDDELDAGVTPAFDGENDTVFTGAGEDLVDLSTTSSDSRVFAGTGSDELVAGQRDRLFGGPDGDILEASAGTGGNRLYGGEGPDELIAGSGDRLFGGPGDDTFFLDALGSEGGENRAYGQSGNDTFFLGTGDRLLGDEGDDAFFVGTGGDNTITGGSGADPFWITTGELPTTTNTITDFEAGIDVIGLGGLGLTFDDLTITPDGANTLISALGQELAILLGVDSTSLGSSSFLFS